VPPLQEEDLKRLHEGAIKDDPFISSALGPNAKIERMRAAALRLGSQGLTTSFDNHLLIIGDAAGHIDPLTGEGIHTALLVPSPPPPPPSSHHCHSLQRVHEAQPVRLGTWVLTLRSSNVARTASHFVTPSGRPAPLQCWYSNSPRYDLHAHAYSLVTDAADTVMVEAQMYGPLEYLARSAYNHNPPPFLS